MASPFPGVDPYLEGFGLWPDFHFTFIGCWREALLDRLPEGYDARIGERVNLIDITEARTKEIGPDVAVSTDESTRRVSVHAGGATATLEPVSVPHLMGEEHREGYIEIVRREDQTLVAVLELLSPSNKEEPGLSLYLDKRNHVLRQQVHLFELDLLLGGRRLPQAGPLPAGDFYAFLSRAEERFDCKVYAWSMRDPLPKLPIPLLAPDPDVIVDFADIYATTYGRGRYARAVAYTRTLELRLSREDREWISSQIQAKKL
jgi:hypothetical protein